MPKHIYDTDELSSSEEDVGPSCHVARKRRKGGNVSWASGPEPPSCSSDDEVVVRPKRATGRAVPKPEVVPNQRIEALESSFNTLVENNSLLMEQNKLFRLRWQTWRIGSFPRTVSRLAGSSPRWSQLQPGCHLRRSSCINFLRR